MTHEEIKQFVFERLPLAIKAAEQGGFGQDSFDEAERSIKAYFESVVDEAIEDYFEATEDDFDE